LARQLSDPDLLKETYLAATWLKSCDIYRNYVNTEQTEEKQEEDSNISTRKRASSFFASKVSPSSTLLETEEARNLSERSSVVCQLFYQNLH
jgi:hypothetical protein